MPTPKQMGNYLYKKIWDKYDENWGSAIVTVVGGQGSVKTACCLDIVEKKMRTHPDEKIFWHDTVGSPCQYRKAKFFPYKIFVEQNLKLQFINITAKQVIHPDIVYFDGIEDLFGKSSCGTINVVYFNNRKSWVGFKDKNKTGLIEFLLGSHDWQTIVFDEMESVFPADCNNQTDDRWWDWTNEVASEMVKEGRKSRVSIGGNFHDPNAIYHSVYNKFMFHIWGFGSRPKRSRVKQSCVDQCDMGEFWIDHQGSKFGKIRVKEVYNPPMEEWIVKRI